MNKFSKSAFLFLYVHSSFIFAAPANLTWVGNTSSMGTASNWSPAQVPNATEPHDNLTFPDTMGPTRSVVNDIAGSLLIGNISIEDDYHIGGANSFTISAETGYLLTFTGSGASIDMSASPGMILNGTWEVTSTAGGNAIDTVIQGTTGGNLYLTNGLLELGGNNQYNGVLTVGNEAPLGMNPTATLRATAANAFGSSAYKPVVTVSSTAILDLNGFDNAVGTLGGPTGGQVLLGTATLTVSNGSAQVPLYGEISGTGGILVTTNGLALMATNTYEGATTIEAGGHLALITPGETSEFAIGAGGGALVFGQSGTYSIPLSLEGDGTLGLGYYSVTLSGTISATGAQDIAKTGPGTLTLTGTNTSGGNIHVWGGVLRVNSASLGNYTGFTWDPPTPTVGVLQINGNIGTISQPVAFSGGPGIIDTNGNNVVITGAVQGGHYFTKEGTGTLTLAAIGNNYAAKTKISRGILNVIPTTYDTSTQTVFNGAGAGILQINADYNPFAASVVFMANGSIDTNSHSMNITGVVAGTTTFTFNKIGNGTLTLSGANLYTGPTHVAAGVLQAGTSSITTGTLSGAFGVNSAITVDSGATLSFQTFANSVGALSNSGAVSTSATITATSYTQASSGSLLLDFPTSSATPFGNVSTTGSISLTGTLTVTDTGGYTPTTGTEIILLQSSGSGKLLTGTFTAVSLPAEFSGLGTLRYNYSQNQVLLGISGCNGDWDTAGNGNWGNTANWEGGCAPGVGNDPSAHDVANFPTVGTSTVTVTLATSAGSAAQTVTLHDINFDATATIYTIEQFDSSSLITLDTFPIDTSPPRINVNSGTSTINAPIAINQNSYIYLSGGTLTLGASTTITGATQTLFISEGSSIGTMTNRGSITPFAVTIEGGALTNTNTIQPSSTLTISGLNGLVSPLTVTNTGTMSAPTVIVGNALAATTTIINSATFTSTGPFTIQSGSLTNNSLLQAGSSSTLTLTGGTLTNNQTATLGSSSSALVLNGGALTTSNQVLASTYTQNSNSSLTLDFPTSNATPYGNILATGSVTINGTLTVNDTGDYMPPATTEIVLLKSSGTGKLLSGTFSAVSLAAEFASTGSVHYDYSENEVLLQFSTCNGVWDGTSSGNWGNTANWVGGCAPGVGSDLMDHDVATFENVAASNITVSLETSGGGVAQSVTLHDIVFNATTTNFTVQQFSGSSQIILDSDMLASAPRISALAGSSTINAPIVLNTDSHIYLSGGSLILGASTTITGTSTLYISEGATPSLLTNNGSITPESLIHEGGFFTNNGTVSTTDSINIAGLGGIILPLELTNNGTMTAGASFTIGGTSGGASVINQGVMTAVGAFQIISDTTTNETGATLRGASLLISGGTLTNEGTVGASDANLSLTGGQLITTGQTLAATYTQSGSGALQLNVSYPPPFPSGILTASHTASLDGALTVNALPGFPTTAPGSITLISSSTSVTGQFATTAFTNFPSSIIPSITYNPESVVLNTRDAVPTHSNATTHIIYASILQHSTFINRKSFQIKSRIGAKGRSISTTVGDLSLLTQNTEVLDITTIEEESGEVLDTLFIDIPSERKEINLVRNVQQARDYKPIWNIYAAPIAGFGHVDTEQEQVGFGYTAVGGFLGFDVTLPKDPELSRAEGGVGAIIEYREQWGNAEQNAGSFSSDKLHASVYGTLIPTAHPNLFFDWIGGFAYTWDDTTRNTGLNQELQAKGKTNEEIFIFSGGIEYLGSIRPSFSITPYLHLQYAYDHINAYTETGAGIYDLNVQAQNIHSFLSSLGARFDCYSSWTNFDIVFEIDAEWIHEYLNSSRTILFTPLSITGIPTPISTIGAPPNSGLIALDLLFTFSKKWQLEADGVILFNNLLYDTSFFLSIGRLF